MFRYKEHYHGSMARKPGLKGKAGHYGSLQWDVPWESAHTTDHRSLNYQHVQGDWKAQPQEEGVYL